MSLNSIEKAKTEINKAWVDYQQVQPVCLQFGKTCYDWQQKLQTTALSKVWKELNIPETRAYVEMDLYLESIGQKRLRIEKRKNREEPDEFESIRKVALTMLSIGFKELQKTDIKSTLLDSAKTWAQCKLKEKIHETTSLHQQ